MGQPSGYGFVSYAADGSSTYLPLKSVSAKVYIADVSARVVLTQLYTNSGSKEKSTKVQYVFPVPASGAVSAFKMQTSDGRVVKGVVKERTKANREYQVAVAKNQWAGLLYEATPDVFVISMGAIPSKQDIEVTITYVVELTDGDLPGYDNVRFSLPTYIASRYGKNPVVASPSSDKNTAKFDVTAEIQMTTEILDVLSPSHAIKVETSKKPPYTSKVTLDPNATSSALDSEFILTIQAAKLGQPRCVAERRPKEMTVALSLTFVPRFKIDRLPSQEYVFLVDRSGSMQTQNRIGHAKEALVLFLKSLPSSGTFFNIFSFGSKYSSLWPSSKQNTSSTLDEALKHVDSMTADMGGTEIKNPLEIAMASSNQIPKSVFLLTDGEVWGVDDILALVSKKVANAGRVNPLRVFSLGVGDGASTALCEGVARNGNGICLMTTQSEDISQKCARLLLASTLPPLGSMDNIKVDWGYSPSKSGTDGGQKSATDKGKVTMLFDDDYDPLAQLGDPKFNFTLPPPPLLQQAPTRIPDIYPANRFTVSVILSDTKKVPKTVTLSGKLPDGTQIALPAIKVHQIADPSDDVPPLIHTLAAHRLVLELEDGNTDSQGSFDRSDAKLCAAVAQAAVIRFSETYQIASSFASFIAVEEKDDEDSEADDSEVDDDDDEEDDDEEDDDDDDEEEDEDEDKDDEDEDEGDEDDEDEDEDSEDKDDSDVDEDSDSVQSDDDDSNNVAAAPGKKKARNVLFNFSMKSLDTQHAPVSRFSMASSSQSAAASAPSAQNAIGLQSSAKATKPIGDVTWTGSAPILAIARLQSFDGSFKLDDKLCAAIGKTSSLSSIRAALPANIRGQRDAENIWATAIAAAYLKVLLAGDKEVWIGLWHKAADFVKLKLGSGVSFALLVDEAVKLL